jgi:predicted HAD superfamily phosphohydrolase YqeG
MEVDMNMISKEEFETLVGEVRQTLIEFKDEALVEEARDAADFLSYERFINSNEYDQDISTYSNHVDMFLEIETCDERRSYEIVEHVLARLGVMVIDE